MGVSYLMDILFIDDTRYRTMLLLNIIKYEHMAYKFATLCCRLTIQHMHSKLQLKS